MSEDSGRGGKGWNEENKEDRRRGVEGWRGGRVSEG